MESVCSAATGRRPAGGYGFIFIQLQKCGMRNCATNYWKKCSFISREYSSFTETIIWRKQRAMTLKSDLRQPLGTTAHAADCRGCWLSCNGWRQEWRHNSQVSDATVAIRNCSSSYLRVVYGMAVLCSGWLSIPGLSGDKWLLLRQLSPFCIVCPMAGTVLAYVCSCNCCCETCI